MSALGVHLALTNQEVAALQACPDVEARLALIREDYEDRYFQDHPQHLAETDKAWDGIHRVLSDGTLSLGAGTYPLNSAVTGGQQLSDDPDEIMSLKSADQVRDIAQALRMVDQAEFRPRFGMIDEHDYGRELSAEEADGIWEYFLQLQDFYQRAASAERPVLFTGL